MSGDFKLHHHPIYRRMLAKRASVALIAALVLTFVILAIVPPSTAPEAHLLLGESRTENPSFSFISDPSTGRRNIVVMNATPFPGGLAWDIEGHSESQMRSEFTENLRDDGLLIGLSNSEVTYSYYLNLPVQDFRNVSFHFEAEVLTGSAELSMSIRYDRWWMEVGRSEVSSVANQGELLKLDALAPQSLFDPAYTDWMIQALLGIRVRTESQGHILIRGVLAEAASSTDLNKVIIDIQDGEGSSLFQNMFTRKLDKYPAINISRDSESEFALIMPRSPNETIFLPSGNYSGFYGWKGYYDLEDRHSFNITASEGFDSRWVFKLPTLRLHLFLSPSIPTYIDIEYGSLDRLYHFWDLRPPFPDFLYLPANAESLQVEVGGMIGHWTFERLSIEADGKTDIILRANFPFFSFLGIALAPGWIVLVLFLIGLVIVLAVSVQKASAPIDIIAVLKKPRISPFIFLLSASVLPWSVTSHVRSSVSGPVTEYQSIMYPLCQEWKWSLDALIIPEMVTIGVIWVFVFFTYWVPLWISYLRLRERKQKIWDVTLFGSLLVPTSIVVWAHLAGSSLEIGSLLVLSTPIIWLIESLIYMFRKRVG
ncbi:MAG: hypothetical protein ACFFAD_15875 [Candidatus Hermodarchaeota archaeon]